MLDGHFPDTIHEDILAAVGLTLETGPAATKKRDPAFRKKVLVAYEYRCAVCDLDVRLDQLSVALEAAHIRWHQYGGPDDESNGLALCVLHHKLFDLGAFTVSDGVVLVSEHAIGGPAFEQTLLAYHGKPMRPPQNPMWKPHVGHLDWPWKEVFRKEP